MMGEISQEKSSYTPVKRRYGQSFSLKSEQDEKRDHVPMEGGGAIEKDRQTVRERT